jgi:hypothetical protein
MKIDVTARIAFPRELVFAAYRDHLPELVPYLENVRAITVSSRTDEGGVTKIVNRWKGGGEIPGVVRKFLSEELLEWDDHATWNPAEWRCEWVTVVPAFKDAVDARGHNEYRDVNGHTELKIVGELKVDATKVRGVPRLLAGTVGPAVESFLVGRIRPNFLTVAQGVEAYLAAKR